MENFAIYGRPEAGLFKFLFSLCLCAKSYLQPEMDRQATAGWA